MTDRIAENADLMVDEMKRKARRRLVGAIVLALAAVIILPMLLEKEPRPLGDDVSVKIPPVDAGKFVNRLSGKSGDAKELPKTEERAEAKGVIGKTEGTVAARVPTASPLIAVTPAAPETGESAAAKTAVAEAERRVLAPATKSPPKADVNAAPVPETKVEAKPAAADVKPADVEAKTTSDSPNLAPPVVSPSAPPASTTRPAPPLSTTAPAARVSTAPAKVEGYVVQLAAFADDKGANSLANRLKKVGYAAFVEPVQTSRGTLWRVRVGGYATKPEADAARAKLKGEGFNGIVAAAS